MDIKVKFFEDSFVEATGPGIYGIYFQTNTEIILHPFPSPLLLDTKTLLTTILILYSILLFCIYKSFYTQIFIYLENKDLTFPIFRLIIKIYFGGRKFK